MLIRITGVIDEHAIVEQAKLYIDKVNRKLIKEFNWNIECDNIFLILSIFYKNEIPIKRCFVEAHTNKALVCKLIEINEIKVSSDKYSKNEYLSLHHSELALLYLRAFKAYDTLSHELKRLFKDNWEENIFATYFNDNQDEVKTLFNSTPYAIRRGKSNTYYPYHDILIAKLIDGNVDNIIKIIDGGVSHFFSHFFVAPNGLFALSVSSALPKK